MLCGLYLEHTLEVNFEEEIAKFVDQYPVHNPTSTPFNSTAADEQGQEDVRPLLIRPDYFLMGPIADVVEIRLMFEILIGEESDFVDFIRLLPSAEELQHLMWYYDQDAEKQIALCSAHVREEYADRKKNEVQLRLNAQRYFCHLYTKGSQSKLFRLSALMEQLLCSPDLWLWVGALKNTRAWAMDSTQDPYSNCFVPIMDLFNHERSQGVVQIGAWEDEAERQRRLDVRRQRKAAQLKDGTKEEETTEEEKAQEQEDLSSQAFAVLTASSDMDRGSVVNFNYGNQRTLEHFFLNYGFVAQDAGVVVESPFSQRHLMARGLLEPPTLESVKHMSTAWQQALRRGCFNLTSSHCTISLTLGIQPLFVQCGRLFHVEPWEEAEVADRGEEWVKEYSLQNELSSSKSFHDDLAFQLDGTGSSLMEDEDLLHLSQPPLSYRERVIVQYRMKERELVTQFLGIVSSHHQRLLQRLEQLPWGEDPFTQNKRSLSIHRPSDHDDAERDDDREADDIDDDGYVVM